jgi:hypothetical protein
MINQFTFVFLMMVLVNIKDLICQVPCNSTVYISGSQTAYRGRKNYREKVFGYRENIFKLFCYYLLSIIIEKSQFNYRKTLSLKKATTGQKV